MNDEQCWENAQQLLVQFQEARALLKQNRLWRVLPLCWLVLWTIRRSERHLQEDLAASGYTYRRGPTSVTFHWPWR